MQLYKATIVGLCVFVSMNELYLLMKKIALASYQWRPKPIEDGY